MQNGKPTVNSDFFWQMAFKYIFTTILICNCSIFTYINKGKSDFAWVYFCKIRSFTKITSLPNFLNLQNVDAYDSIFNHMSFV